MNPDSATLGTLYRTSPLNAVLQYLIAARNPQMSVPAFLPSRRQVLLRPSFVDPEGGPTSSRAFRHQLSLTSPSRLHKGHHAVPYGGRLNHLQVRKPQSQSLVLFPLCSLFPNIMASSIMCRLLMPSRRPQRSISLLNSRAVYPTTFSTPSLGCLKGISVSPIISS